MNLTEIIESRRDQHLAELCEFLRIPSVSAKSEHKPDIERGARWVADRLQSAGFKTVQVIPTSLHPLVYAESLEVPGKPTILFYGHYDVQPAEPLDLWTSPAFEPTVRNGNLYGRGTADDKGQVHIHLKAFESLRDVNGKLPINVKVLIEGEEEVGSPHFEAIAAKYAPLLQADGCLWEGSGFDKADRPILSLGTKGLLYVQLDVQAMNVDAHSGTASFLLATRPGPCQLAYTGWPCAHSWFLRRSHHSQRSRTRRHRCSDRYGRTADGGLWSQRVC